MRLMYDRQGDFVRRWDANGNELIPLQRGHHIKILNLDTMEYLQRPLITDDVTGEWVCYPLDITVDHEGHIRTISGVNRLQITYNPSMIVEDTVLPNHVVDLPNGVEHVEDHNGCS